jgi:hypothetical protein
MLEEIVRIAGTNKTQTYALLDQKEAKHRAAIRINRASAKEWNDKGYGIFQTLNVFYGNGKRCRKTEDLVWLNGFCMDMDGGDKESQLKKINQGLPPTMLVETKNGYQAYLRCSMSDSDLWKQIMWNRLLPFYASDPKAKDIAHLFRVPGFFHLKDPANPYLIKMHYNRKIEYTPRELCLFYKDTETPKKQKKEHNKAKRFNPGHGDFWERVYNLNCEYALEKLSGTEYVGSETFEFRQNSIGTKQIYVNGKSTSCWINEEGRIGSSDKAGPTVYQWINWYQKNPARSIEIIKQEFPECLPNSQMNLI